MQQTTLRVFNFALIFALALLTTYFTLENTALATINILPGVSGSLPVATLVIISIGVGACGTWLFATWSDKLRGEEIKELEETRNRMKELQNDFNRLKATQNNLLPVLTVPEGNDSSAVDSTL